MPGKDLNVWEQTEDGSWIRKRSNSEEPVAKEKGPNATSGAVDAAAELGIDLTTISGTGKDGKITKADVEAATN